MKKHSVYIIPISEKYPNIFMKKSKLQLSYILPPKGLYSLPPPVNPAFL